MDLKDKIKKRRQELGLTLEEVAQVVGVGKSTVRKWETGYIENMRRDKIAKLAEALHTTPAYLMDWEDPEENKPAAESDGLDPEMEDLLYRAKNDPHMRMLFSLAKDWTPEDLDRAIRIIQAYKGE